MFGGLQSCEYCFTLTWRIGREEQSSSTIYHDGSKPLCSGCFVWSPFKGSVNLALLWTPSVGQLKKTSVLAPALLILHCYPNAMYFFRSEANESEALTGKKVVRSWEENKLEKLHKLY